MRLYLGQVQHTDDVWRHSTKGLGPHTGGGGYGFHDDLAVRVLGVAGFGDDETLVLGGVENGTPQSVPVVWLVVGTVGAKVTFVPVF